MKKRAGDLFSRAEKAFEEKNYQKALVRFLCSLYMVEHDVTVTNIERVVERIQNRKAAQTILDDYIKLNPDGALTPRIEALHAGIEIDPPPPPPPPCPPTPPPCPPPKPCPKVPNIRDYESAHETSLKMLQVFGWTSTGAGAASIIAGVALQVSAARASPKEEKKDKLQAGAIAGFVAGAAASGIGAAELIIWSKRKKMLSALRAGPKVDAPATDVVSRITVAPVVRGVQLTVQF